jgi:site-specific DNA recombinase
MRAAIYARVSSDAQRDARTIESQHHSLRPFVERQGWGIAGEYVDDGRSAKTGKLDKRQGYAQLLADAAEGKFEILVTSAMDRLTRTEDLIELAAILGPLQRAGIRIVSPSTGEIDLRSEHGPLIAFLQAHAAAVENARRAQRVKAGKDRAIAQGRKPAGPTPYGYRYDRELGLWSIFEPEALIVREIFERAAANETGDSIARDLELRGVPRPRAGAWNRERVYGALRQGAYRGAWVADKRRGLTVATPRIVDDALWFAARDRDGALQRRGRRTQRHVYLLEGLATCALCGAPIGVASACARSVNRAPCPARYVCSRRRRPDEQGRCDLPYFTTAETDAKVWAAIRELVVTPGRIERAAARELADAGADSEAWRRDLDKAEKRLAQLLRAEKAVLARARSGLVSEAALDSELAAIKQGRELAEHQVDAATRAQFAAGRAATRAQALAALVSQLRTTVDACSAGERQELVQRLLKPRSVVLSIATIEMRARVHFAGAVAAAGCSDERPTSITFRLVA